MAKRVLLVTGAASGIGAAVTKLAADQGWTVAVCDVNRDAGQSLAQATGGRFFYCDVTDLSSVSSAVEGCISELGVPNYAHLNAGVMTVPAGQPYLALEDLSQAQYRNIVGVNLDGCVSWCQNTHTAYAPNRGCDYAHGLNSRALRGRC